jgi:UDP-N-acetylmuramoyl-tripeptide--D-alanyl-D-alanine ligase
MRLQRCRGGADGNIAILLDADNANPASVAAAIDVLCAHPVPNGGRRVAVLGEMRELGSHAGPLHHEIAERAAAAGIDMMVAVGAHAKRMAAAARDWHKQRPGSRPMEIHTAIDTASATRRIAKLCRPGDLVLIKGSRAVALERVAEALMSKDAGNGN